MYRTICLATDLDPHLLAPWELAWRLASTAGADLVALHVPGQQGEAPWHRMPRPGDLMERWGVPGQAHPDGFRGAGWSGSLRTSIRQEGPEALSFWLRFERPDLVVLGSHRRNTASRLLRPSVGELLARSAPRAALVLPDGVRSILDPVHGDLQLRRVLVPVGPDTDPQPAVDAAVELLASSGSRAPLAFIVLHVGEHVPEVVVPAPHMLFLTLGLGTPEPVVQRITDVAAELDVDLIAMVTRGHDSLSDTLLGSHTDQVIRRAPTPVLVVRAG